MAPPVTNNFIAYTVVYCDEVYDRRSNRVWRIRTPSSALTTLPHSGMLPPNQLTDISSNPKPYGPSADAGTAQPAASEANVAKQSGLGQKSSPAEIVKDVAALEEAAKGEVEVWRSEQMEIARKEVEEWKKEQMEIARQEVEAWKLKQMRLAKKEVEAWKNEQLRVARQEVEAWKNAQMEEHRQSEDIVGLATGSDGKDPYH